MGRIKKPGFDPKAIKERTRAAQLERERLARDFAAADPYELPPDVRPLRVKKPLIVDPARTVSEFRDDPTLLMAVQWALGKLAMGHTYRQISQASAEELGMELKETRLRRLCAKELAKRSETLVRDIRRREDHRLDYLLTKLEAGVNSGDVQAIHEARLISESRRKMFGADMPANIRVTGEVEHKLDPAVTKMIEESKARIAAQQEQTVKGELEDPEVIDAEVIEDDPDYREEPYQEFPVDPDEEEIEDL